MVFTQICSKCSRELLPSSLCDEWGTRRKLFRKTRSDELLNFFGWIFLPWVYKVRRPRLKNHPFYAIHQVLLSFGSHSLGWSNREDVHDRGHVITVLPWAPELAKWFSEAPRPQLLGHDMGGASRMREKMYQTMRPPDKFLDPSKWASGLFNLAVLYRKQSNDTWKCTRRRGIRKPFLEGVSFVRFSSPLFFPPPLAYSSKTHATEGPRGDDPKNDLVLVVRFFRYV